MECEDGSERAATVLTLQVPPPSHSSRIQSVWPVTNHCRRQCGAWKLHQEVCPGRRRSSPRRPTGHAPRGQRGAGSAAPRLYLSGARPPRTGSGGHLAGAGDAAEGRRRRTGRAFRSRRRTFLREVPRLGAGAAGRGGESGVPGRSRSAPPPHNMASSASWSAAGAEGTPPAQGDYGSYYSQSSTKKLSSLVTTSLIRQHHQHQGHHRALSRVPCAKQFIMLCSSQWGGCHICLVKGLNI
ncbi:uncharacterized protein [Odocoileus virginianus]|uniref:Uncharacterized protein n=1 Tax=Odocoileus virginianus TaxID=9874 RepID=A0ABM4IDP7_ODOVR